MVRRKWWRRLKWERICTAVILVACAGAFGYRTYCDTAMTQLVEYRQEVEPGDTLWSICARLATDKEDMGKLVWQTAQDNHISDPGNLQPGTELIVHVKQARSL